MSETKHTPGPWEITGQESVWVKADRFTFCPMVGNDSTEEDPEVWKANARLIAAAPELLEACKAAVNALRSYQYGNASTELAESIATHVAAAISKAEGKQ